MFSVGVFFSMLLVLQLVDAWSTYTGLKLSGGTVDEANPILKNLFKKLGVKETLFLVKAILLSYLWFYPVIGQQEQLILLSMYVVVAINNLWIIKKLKG